ncbi:phytoene/squalene synthase family protein [Georgenia sp. H159]|uniref:phytoene/squalene synthase family protein n=1 Tax=Georgenia sp. H159 TaxID=3076115 RepID=UPI002D76B147|nr:phytoene/squalene synthase family protein [Georgenia sp. H159]
MSMLARRPAPTRPYDAVASASAAVVIRTYSTSFGWACRLLAEPEREHVRNVYALVRVADEIVDEPDATWSAPARAVVLDGLEEETYRAVEGGRSANLVVHAFARTARRYGIGRDLIAPFFASMRADLSVSRHDDASLARYVHGSAEVVGLMCLRIFVGGDDDAYARLAPGAGRLGAAFQKVNFLRDLAEDHDALGRTYFPGLDPATFGDAHRDVLLDAIDEDLAAAERALVQLPPSSRRAVRAAHALFTELSRRLRATPAAEIRTRRVRVPDAVKARLVLRSVLSGGRR